MTGSPFPGPGPPQSAGVTSQDPQNQEQTGGEEVPDQCFQGQPPTQGQKQVSVAKL